MPSPAKKRPRAKGPPAEKRVIDRALTPQPDADLEVFRSMRQVSRRATARQLDRLIGPEE